MKQRKGVMTHRLKENLKLSHGGPSQRKALGTNQWIKALSQAYHWVRGLTHRCTIKKETIAINCDWDADCHMISIFLGWTSTMQRLKCLAQEHITVHPMRLEPATPWISSTLPLSHYASQCEPLAPTKICKRHFQILMPPLETKQGLIVHVNSLQPYDSHSISILISPQIKRHFNISRQPQS